MKMRKDPEYFLWLKKEEKKLKQLKYSGNI